MIAAITTSELLLIVAMIMFFVGAVMHMLERNVIGVLLMGGLGVFAWSFLALSG